MIGINDAILLMVITFLVVSGFRNLWLSFQLDETWPAVDGIVYVFRTHIRQETNGDVHGEPGIRCLYKVNGVAHILNLDNSISKYCTQQEWETVSRYYPSGFTVVVHYHPNNPKRAFVKPVKRSGS